MRKIRLKFSSREGLKWRPYNVYDEGTKKNGSMLIWQVHDRIIVLDPYLRRSLRGVFLIDNRRDTSSRHDKDFGEPR